MHENEMTHALVKDNTGLSVGYRIMWRLRYLGNDIYGPASRQPGLNPREQLRVERAQRVATAYRSMGEEPPPLVRRAAGEDTEPDPDADRDVWHGRQPPKRWPPKPFQEGHRYVRDTGEERPATGTADEGQGR